MWKGLRLIKTTPNLRFMQYRHIGLRVSVALLLAGVALVWMKGLNFGIDFRGGILLELRTPQTMESEDLRADLENFVTGEVVIQQIQGAEDSRDYLVRIQKQSEEEGAGTNIVEEIRAALGAEVDFLRTEIVGPTISGELIVSGIWAVLLALGGIMVYVWLRFEWQFGLCALIALAHDVFLTVALFALIQHEFNMATLAALLTLAGYSINDTVVIFDRVREKIIQYPKMPLPDVLDKALNETLSRTVLTGLTTALALCGLFVFGGPAMADFAFAMLWGILVGTYSSVMIAVPLLINLGVDSSHFVEGENT